jgi:hypothetical protein
MFPAASWPIPCNITFSCKNVENAGGTEAVTGPATRNNAAATNATKAVSLRRGKIPRGNAKHLIAIA